MSPFFDEVFAAQQAPPSPSRRAGEGLSGSGRRFATLLTFMVGLTAVPTFIMVQAGVEELRSSAATPVRPILLLVPDNAPPANRQPPVIEPPQSWSPPATPAETVVPQRLPILERTATVDTADRPVIKRRKASKVDPQLDPRPVVPALPVPPTPPAPPRPPASPSLPDIRPGKPKQRKHHHVVPPRVERPERPVVPPRHRDSAVRARS